VLLILWQSYLREMPLSKLVLSSIYCVIASPDGDLIGRNMQ
jgi:hypothetical protein